MMGVLLAGAVATWGMVGVIWMVQLVQYPMLATYSRHAPSRAATEHQRRITPIVGPLMATEGITALILLVARPDTMSAASAWLAAALLGVALASTAFVQVPLHARLAAGDDPDAARRLVSGNWIRTAAWTARGALLAAVLAT
jgi:uncharacterized membrane protein